MRGGAIQLLLLKNIGGGCVVCNSVDWCDLFCKKMEIVDEMLELVNLCYCTHWHSTHIVNCDDCCCCIYHAVAVDVHNIELFAVAVVADDALLKILLLLHLAARHHQMDFLSYYNYVMCVYFFMMSLEQMTNCNTGVNRQHLCSGS